jgi:uncharacterized membrane protein
MRGVVVLFVLLGVVQAVSLPPFQAPDENEHWNTSVWRLEKALGAADAPCRPEFDLSERFETLRVAGHPEEKLRRDFGERFAQSAAAAPCLSKNIIYGGALSYPAVSALLLATRPFVGADALALKFYLARVLQGLLVALALFVFLRRLDGSTVAHAAGFAVSCLALSPLFLQQSFAVTSDVVVNAFALLLASLALSPRRNTAFVVFLGVAGLCAVTTKPFAGAFVVPPLIWLAVRERSEGRNFFARVEAWLLVGLFVAGVAAALVARGGFSSVSEAGRDPSLQLRLLFDHPVKIFGEILAQPWSYLLRRRWLRGPLGWLDTPLGPWLWAALWALWGSLLWAAAKAGLRWGSWQGVLSRLGLLCASLSIAQASLLSLTLFLTWTSGGLMRIDGFQGRYLFPNLLLAVAFLALAFWKPEKSDSVGRPARGPRLVFWMAGGAFALALTATHAARYF